MSYTSFLNKKTILKEGGSFKGISKPIDRPSLTMASFNDIIFKMIDGSISKNQAELKTDGVGLMVSYIDDKVVFSRTAKHLRDGGKDALKSPQELRDYLKKIPEHVKDNFFNGAFDISNCLNKIDKLTLKQIFKENTWLSVELMRSDEKLINVINYFRDIICLHTLVQVNNNGTIISDDRKLVKKLFEEIEKANAEHQKTFTIIKSVPAIFNPNPNQDEEKKNVESYMKTFMKEYSLSDNSTIKDYTENWWKRYIKKNSKFDVTEEELEILTDRFLNNDVDLSLTNFKKYYGDDMSDWITSVDNLSKELNRTCLSPLRNLYDKISYLAIGRLKTTLSADLDKSKKDFHRRFMEQIKLIKQMDKTDKHHDRFDSYFRDLNKQIPVDEIVIGDEGFIFFYGDNNLYKGTGWFSQVNQLMGEIRYNT